MNRLYTAEASAYGQRTGAVITSDDRLDLQLSRPPRALPHMQIDPTMRSIFDFKYEDFKLTGYDPHPHIKAEVAV